MGDSNFEDKRSLLAKIRNFPKVDAAEVSVTFLEDLCPTIPVLVKNNVVGNVNFVNPGAVKYAEVVERFVKKLGEDYKKPEVKTGGGRGSILMDSEKLVKAVEGGVEIKTAEQCLDVVFG